jgi:exosortase A
VTSVLSHQSSSITRFAVFLATTLALFWSTASQIANTVWNAETYSHGILIPAIVIWLFWRNRGDIFDAPVETSWLAVLAVVACVSVWCIGKIVDYRVLQNFGFIGTIIAGWAVCVGLPVFRKSLFPALFLLFVVPFGTFLDQPLMHATAEFTVQTLRLIGVPVFQEGLQFRLPSGNWSVIEACSGLRYLLASIILGSLFAYLNFTTWKKRLGFVFLCIAVAIIANWIRAVTVVLVGHLSEMRYGTGDDHVWYGWVFFGVVMFAVFYLANRFTETASSSGSKTTNESKSTIVASPHSSSKFWMPVFAALILLIGARTLVTKVTDKAIRPDFFSTIKESNVFSKVDKLNYEPHFTNSISQLKLKDLTDEINSIEVFAAYFADQAKKGKMISSENGLVKPDTAWKIISFDQAPLDANENFYYEAIVQAGPTKRLVFYWYQFPGSSAPNRYAAARIQLTRALKLKSDEAVFAAVSMPITVGDKAARGQLHKVARDFQSLLATELQSGL